MMLIPGYQQHELCRCWAASSCRMEGSGSAFWREVFPNSLAGKVERGTLRCCEFGEGRKDAWASFCQCEFNSTEGCSFRSWAASLWQQFVFGQWDVHGRESIRRHLGLQTGYVHPCRDGVFTFQGKMCGNFKNPQNHTQVALCLQGDQVHQCVLC